MSNYTAGEDLQYGDVIYFGSDGKLYPYRGGLLHVDIAPFDLKRGDVITIVEKTDGSKTYQKVGTFDPDEIRPLLPPS